MHNENVAFVSGSGKDVMLLGITSMQLKDQSSSYQIRDRCEWPRVHVSVQ